MSRARRARNECGQAFLELAIAFPVLTLLLLGAVQFGLWYHAQSVVQAACQDAARVGSAEGSSIEEGLVRARQILAGGLGPLGEAVAVQGSADQERVVFTARGSLRTIIPWVNQNSLPLRGEASVHRERFREGNALP